MKSSLDKYLDLKGLSEYSSLGVSTLREYIRCERLPHFKVRGKILVRISEFDEWMELSRVDEESHLAVLVDSVIDRLDN